MLCVSLQCIVWCILLCSLFDVFLDLVELLYALHGVYAVWVVLLTMMELGVC